MSLTEATEATEAIEHLTAEELDQLKSCKNDEEWGAACRAVKEVRNGQWPPDWYEKVIKPGLIDQVLGKGAGDVSFHAVNEEGELEEVGRFSPSEEPEEGEGKRRWPALESLVWAKYRLRLMEVHLDHLESFQAEFDGNEGGTHPFTTATIVESMSELEKTGGVCEKVLTRIKEAAASNELESVFDTPEEASTFEKDMELVKAQSDALYRRYGLFQFRVLSGMLPFTKGEKEKMVKDTVEAFKKHFGDPATEG
jgi:hypothetical protein